MSATLEYAESTTPLGRLDDPGKWTRRLAALRYLILPAILIAFLIQGFRLIPGYRGQMNPDGVSYLTIARQYQHGHFADAVNAYWSPLYSWLLVPLLVMGVESLLATKVLAILIGGGCIASVWWLLRNLSVGVDSRVIACVALFPILYYFGMDVTTPDLLMTMTLLLYVAQMTSRRWGRRWWHGPLAGVLAGVAYLAKAYALPVVGAHLVLVNLWRLRNRKRLVQPGIALLVFAVIVLSWGGILRHKYGYFTTGTTGTFNIAFNGPHFEMPMHRGSLIPPPNESGTSGWDDATLLDYTPWKPWATADDRAAWEKNRTRNEGEIIELLEKFTWLLLPIVIGGIWIAASRLDPEPRRPGAIFVTLLVLYPIGYWLLHVYERFFSLECVGLLVLGVYLAARLVSPLNRWVRVPLRIVLVTVVAWSFLSKPNWRYGRDPWATALDRWSIAGRWDRETQHAHRAAALAGLMPARSRVATVGDWSEGLYVGYLLDLRFYGQYIGGEAGLREQLAKYDIEYLWTAGRAPWAFLKDKPEITNGRMPGIRIYDLREKPTTRP